MNLPIRVLAACLLLSAASGTAADPPKTTPATGGDEGRRAPARPGPGEVAEKRAEALRRVCARLGVGSGASIADVGAGRGTDTFTLAGIAGSAGKVYSEEITEAMRAAIEQKARERGLDQVVAVRGATGDPCLPDGALDLAYMNAVFHHFAQPKSMLAHLRADLKPGGFLVIVDREKGPQREWVDMALREQKHFWTGETTVVRLAREAGFCFETALDELWPDSRSFVLVFRRPAGGMGPPEDPDRPSVLDGRKAVSALPPLPTEDPRLLFVGLDRGRDLLGPLQAATRPGPHIHDVVIEEWTTFKAELPPDASGGSVDGAVEVVRTSKGDLPGFTNRFLHAVVFADGYSRLWDPAPLLRRLRGSLAAGGYVAVLDRRGPADEPRRLAGHRRRIAPELVKTDMKNAGFACVRELDPPAPDRFFLLFRPQEQGE